MIQPNMMMDMAIPMKLAVILWRSAKKKAQQKTPCMSGGVLSFSTLIHQIKKKVTHEARATHPALLSSSD